MRVQVFLQNAWLRHKRRGKNQPDLRNALWREVWLDLLTWCRSGQRLMVMCGADCFTLPDAWDFTNSTPHFGYGTSAARLPAVPEFIGAELARFNPEVVVCCGVQSSLSVRSLWGGPLLSVPHPASRLLTNALYVRAGDLLRSGFTDRGRLRQLRGSCELVGLEYETGDAAADAASPD